MIIIFIFEKREIFMIIKNIKIKNIKNIKKIFFALVTSGVVLTGCGKFSHSEDMLKIVCTSFPQYEWVKAIADGQTENIEIDCIAGSGDIHSYQPTAEDIVKISSCDIFIYNGGESDAWTQDVLKNAVNRDMKKINLMESIESEVKEEEIVEGMQEEQHEHESETETEYDEHVWLSVRNAEKLCKVITENLCKADSSHENIYRENLENYSKKLEKLDSDFEKLSENSENHTLIFADRFPFRYFTDDYNFDYYSAFSGCSADTQASFETVKFLADKIDETGAESVFVIESSDCSIAEAVIENTKNKNQEIFTLDSMQSAPESGEDYISIMKKNYETLKDALE